MYLIKIIPTATNGPLHSSSLRVSSLIVASQSLLVSLKGFCLVGVLIRSEFSPQPAEQTRRVGVLPNLRRRQLDVVRPSPIRVLLSKPLNLIRREKLVSGSQRVEEVKSLLQIIVRQDVCYYCRVFFPVDDKCQPEVCTRVASRNVLRNALMWDRNGGHAHLHN